MYDVCSQFLSVTNEMQDFTGCTTRTSRSIWQAPSWYYFAQFLSVSNEMQVHQLPWKWAEVQLMWYTSHHHTETLPIPSTNHMDSHTQYNFYYLKKWWVLENKTTWGIYNTLQGLRTIYFKELTFPRQNHNTIRKTYW